MANDWKYHECPVCYVLWPHLATPEICVCGNDLLKNYNKKTMKILSEVDEVRGSL